MSEDEINVELDLGKTEVDCARGSDDGTVFALPKNTKILIY